MRKTTKTKAAFANEKHQINYYIWPWWESEKYGAEECTHTKQYKAL